MSDQERLSTHEGLFRVIQSGWKRKISLIRTKAPSPDDFIAPSNSLEDSFLSDYYQRHNQRRQEHLASLGLSLAECTVLEVGAGIGDHTSFFVDRGCQVVSTDARQTNLEVLSSRYPNIRVRLLDCDNPDPGFKEKFDLVYCYGLLYHLARPAQAIEFMSHLCKKMLLLETCVSFGEEESISLSEENPNDPTQSIRGKGCRPTRGWVYNQLKKHFQFVYLPITQPFHEEFPIDWRSPTSSEILSRAVFIASREKLNVDILVDYVPIRQKRG